MRKKKLKPQKSAIGSKNRFSFEKEEKLQKSKKKKLLRVEPIFERNIQWLTTF